VLRGGCEYSTHIPCRFTPSKRPAVLVEREDVWIQASVWNYLYRGSNIEPVWPLGIRYADYAIHVPYYKLITLRFVPCRVEVPESWALLLQSMIQPTASYLLNDKSDERGSAHEMSADRTGYCVCSVLDLYLRMEVAYPADTLITAYQTTRCHIPEYRIMNTNLDKTHQITRNINRFMITVSCMYHQA
jgi:hypothetical protein